MGPACWDVETLVKLIESGLQSDADVRLCVVDNKAV